MATLSHQKGRAQMPGLENAQVAKFDDILKCLKWDTATDASTVTDVLKQDWETKVERVKNQ